MNAIPRAERLIVALDVPSASEARVLAEKLGDAVRFYKIGLELFTAEGYFELLEWLTARGNKVFADLKLYDIPETVRRAVANLRGRGATFLTVHGHRSVMEAAAREKGAMKILAVTVLTSFDQRDLEEMGSTRSVEELVMARARGAAESGCDGVIASGLEAKSAEGPVQGPPAGCNARNSSEKRAGRKRRRRSEAHSRRRAGLRRRRGLHRGRATDTGCARSSGRCGRHPEHDREHLQVISFSSSRCRCSWCGSITPWNSVSSPRRTRMVGKFSTSMSSTASASSSMSTQRNSARGKRSASATKPGR